MLKMNVLYYFWYRYRNFSVSYHWLVLIELTVFWHWLLSMDYAWLNDWTALSSSPAFKFMLYCFKKVKLFWMLFYYHYSQMVWVCMLWPMISDYLRFRLLLSVGFQTKRITKPPKYSLHCFSWKMGLSGI